MNNVIQIPKPHAHAASTAREASFEIVENPPELIRNRQKDFCCTAARKLSIGRISSESAHHTGPTRWYPLPHRTLVTEVENQLQAAGFQLRGATYSLTHDGQRFFGVLQVTLPTRNDREFGWVVGLRNSHDKSLPAGLVAGTQVMVCDNLAFTGEVKLSRKHTRFRHA